MTSKKTLLFIVMLLLPAFPAFGGIFSTSKCFDLLCTPQYIDKLQEDARFSELFADTVFVAKVAAINNKCTASKLCNLYSEIDGDKDDLSKCLFVVTHLDSLSRDVDWAGAILSVQSELSYVLGRLVESGYSEYWDHQVFPRLKSHIDHYVVDPELLDSIHHHLLEFFSPQTLPDTQSKIFILDIENAFNLSDESFCCTPLILDPEIEKQLRLSFLNIYIHEKLHNLYLSPDLISKLSELKDADSFYRQNEAVAQAYGEGKNEAFVVAAEVYVSNKIGLRSMQNVYDELSQYVDGSLVLAPIIFAKMADRKCNETYNEFLLRLFSKGGVLEAGEIENNYRLAMNGIKSGVKE